MIRSLRSRLIAAFAAIIFLTLLLVGIGFIFVLRQYQEQRELLRLGALAGPIAFQVRAVEQQGASVTDIAEFLARQADDLDVRIVLTGAGGMVFHDTESTLIGHRIDLAAAQRYGPLRRARLLTVQGQQGRQLFFVASPPSPPNSALAERFLGRQGSYVVALVSEPVTYLGVLREMASPLLLAALLSLLASIGVAWLLAQSIARPLARIAKAAEEIARGRYEQQISDRGSDEVNRLATSFNTMAREVARSDRTLRDFVANVSHDLRTPLTSIQGFSQAIVDGAVQDHAGYLESGRIINEEATRMGHLVEDLLELSKIESGQVTLDLADVDLAGSVGRSAERATRQAADRGVEVITAFQSTPIARGDAKRLERVFGNLLDNAVVHTPPGGQITVRVYVESGAPAPTGRAVEGRGGPGTQAAIEIQNTGSIIPHDELPRIFERFYRVEKSRTRSGEGSGLGLAIAQEIVQAHGGRIIVASSEAVGTQFTVLLPILPLDPVSTGGLGSCPDRQSEPSANRVRA